MDRFLLLGSGLVLLQVFGHFTGFMDLCWLRLLRLGLVLLAGGLLLLLVELDDRSDLALLHCHGDRVVFDVLTAVHDDHFVLGGLFCDFLFLLERMLHDRSLRWDGWLMRLPVR